MNHANAYDARYVDGVRLFNRREFFAAHDVLEDLWGETLGEHRDFYQGLIHAAVALFHFEEGNLGGARKMYHSCLRYLGHYGDFWLGLNLRRLRDEMQVCFVELLATDGHYPTGVVLVRSDIPVLQLHGAAVGTSPGLQSSAEQTAKYLGDSGATQRHEPAGWPEAGDRDQRPEDGAIRS